MLESLQFELLRVSYRRLPGWLHWRAARWMRSRVRTLGADGRRARIRCTDGFLMELELGEWIGAYIALAGEYEPAVAQAFRELVNGGDTVIDVGANVGFFSLLATSLVGPSGTVHAIEASESTRGLE